MNFFLSAIIWSIIIRRHRGTFFKHILIRLFSVPRVFSNIHFEFTHNLAIRKILNKNKKKNNFFKIENKKSNKNIIFFCVIRKKLGKIKNNKKN